MCCGSGIVILYEPIFITVECFVGGAVVLMLNVSFDALPESKGLVWLERLLKKSGAADAGEGLAYTPSEYLSVFWRGPRQLRPD